MVKKVSNSVELLDITLLNCNEPYFKDLNTFIGVQTPIHFSKTLTELAGGEKKIGKIYLKRTDLHTNHSHKPISAYACCKLAKYLGFKKILTETGAFQNGRAVASACASLGLKLDIGLDTIYIDLIRLDWIGLDWIGHDRLHGRYGVLPAPRSAPPRQCNAVLKLS